MARGNEIVVSANPRGVFTEGYVGAGITPKPGQIMQIDPTVALKGGRHTWKLYTGGANGNRPKGPLAVMLPDPDQGKIATQAYAAGDRCFLYCPLPGEELNLLMKFGDVSDTHAAGEILIVENTTGKVIATAGTPQSAPFVLLESLTLTADTLVWTMFGP